MGILYSKHVVLHM